MLFKEVAGSTSKTQISAVKVVQPNTKEVLNDQHMAKRELPTSNALKKSQGLIEELDEWRTSPTTVAASPSKIMLSCLEDGSVSVMHL